MGIFQLSSGCGSGGEVPHQAKPVGISGPAVLVFGDVVALGRLLHVHDSWSLAVAEDIHGYPVGFRRPKTVTHALGMKGRPGVSLFMPPP